MPAGRCLLIVEVNSYVPSLGNRLGVDRGVLGRVVETSICHMERKERLPEKAGLCRASETAVTGGVAKVTGTTSCPTHRQDVSAR